MAACGAGNATVLRNAKTGHTIGTFKCDDQVNACAISPDSSFLAHGTNSKAGKVKVLDLNAAPIKVVLEFEIKSRVSHITWLDHGKKLAVGGVAKDLTVYDIATKSCNTYTHKAPVNKAWSMCSERNLGACGDRTKKITFFDLDSCNENI